MDNLIVSAECPSCAAPLDFTHGSNAVRCGHCGANLLVTGRKQLLSYFVAAKLGERRAVAEAMKVQRDRGLGEFSDIKAQLYFLPYYRMTGHEFGWEKPPVRRLDEEIEKAMGEDSEDSLLWAGGGKESFRAFDDGTSLLDAAGKLLGIALNKFKGKDAGEEKGDTGKSSSRGKEKIIGPKAAGEMQENKPDLNISVSKRTFVRMGTGSSSETKTGFNISVSRKVSGGMGTAGLPEGVGSLYELGELLLNDRYLEKNFSACDRPDAALYSLGVRPAVLRLELFRNSVLESLGKVVGPELSAQTAEEIGLKTAVNKAALYRKVIARVLSLIYFPFWVVEMKSRGDISVAILDAVSGSVVNPDAGASVYNTLDRTQGGEPRVAAFRPLLCPNCGADLPVRPEDSIFFCANCARAWQICGSELCGLEYRIADSGNQDKGEIKYLPFWILKSGPDKDRPFNFFIPAFRYRRLKFLLEIALRLSRLQPQYSVAGHKAAELLGCCYDSDDAASLARFTQAVLISESVKEFRSDLAESLPLSEASLTWFPFRIQGMYLVAPFGGIRIPINLLM